jgi:hypothetical protein
MNRFWLLCVALLLSFNATARDGSSGCGPGWYVLQDNTLVSSALRATTHGILWPSTTLGMTLGASNCTKHRIVEAEQETLYFATQNYFELMRESSIGGGEFISTYYSTIGCHPHLEQHFSKLVQAQFEQLFPEGETRPEQLVEETYKVIFSDADLTHACSLS